MNKLISSEVKKIIEKIKENIVPEKIILFGSYALGTEKEDSDIDICIITEDKRNKLEIIWGIREDIFDITEHSVDLMIYGKNDFEERKKSMTTLENEIFRTGEVLYG